MISYKLKGMTSHPHLILIPGNKGDEYMGIVHSFDDRGPTQTHLLVYVIREDGMINTVHNTVASRSKKKLGLLEALSVISHCLVDWAESDGSVSQTTDKELRKMNEERVAIIRCLGQMWTSSEDDYRTVKDAYPKPIKPEKDKKKQKAVGPKYRK